MRQSPRALTFLFQLPFRIGSDRKGRCLLQTLKLERKRKGVLAVQVADLAALRSRIGSLLADESSIALAVIAEDASTAWAAITSMQQHMHSSIGTGISQVIQLVTCASARYVSLYLQRGLRSAVSCDEKAGVILYPRSCAPSCTYTCQLMVLVHHLFKKFGVPPHGIAKQLVWQFLAGSVHLCGVAALHVNSMLAGTTNQQLFYTFAPFLSFRWPHQQRSPLQMLEQSSHVAFWALCEEPLNTPARLSLCGTRDAVRAALERLRLLTRSEYPNCLVIKEAATSNPCHENADMEFTHDAKPFWDLSFRNIFRCHDDDHDDYEWYRRHRPGCVEMCRAAAMLGCVIIAGHDGGWYVPERKDDDQLAKWDVTDLCRWCGCDDKRYALRNRAQLKAMATNGFIVSYQELYEGCSRTSGSRRGCLASGHSTSTQIMDGFIGRGCRFEHALVQPRDG
eukprot:TRINITY_DN12644_c0_g3_i3.p1 TRINITY_DN12644_c0_g3~~TRINITY_DN12644_c0_g3_i3.p1  ORF type:complete len:451 (+),score=2.74 TRINITY_DN12644_c0_g3_i3:65-1417(+)